MDINGARFLIRAVDRGYSLGRVATLGRQDMNVYPATLNKFLDKSDLPRLASDSPFAEPFFDALGAEVVVALDMTSYEGATFIHDLNQPIHPYEHMSFDTVFDGGTLEHVFNFPTALANAMNLVRVGGNLFIHAPANNWTGHGLYQFSPELFFRTLCPANGFDIQSLVIHRTGPFNTWYEAIDPAVSGRRTELWSLLPHQLLIHAVKRAHVVPFTTTPQQSDYTPRWQSGKQTNAYAPTRPFLSRHLPALCRLYHAATLGLKTLFRFRLTRQNGFIAISKSVHFTPKSFLSRQK